MPVLSYDETINLVKSYAGDLANDSLFLNIVASGSKAESGWNTDIEQKGGCGVGFFQFDTCGGMGTGLSVSQLTGLSGAKFQASRIVPQYAAAYKTGLEKGLSGVDLATYVIGAAERPRGWFAGAVHWADVTYQNYVSAWNAVSGSSPDLGGSSGIPGGQSGGGGSGDFSNDDIRCEPITIINKFDVGPTSVGPLTMPNFACMMRNSTGTWGNDWTWNVIFVLGGIVLVVIGLSNMAGTRDAIKQAGSIGTDVAKAALVAG